MFEGGQNNHSSNFYFFFLFLKLGRGARCKGRRAILLFTGVKDLHVMPLSDCMSSKYRYSERHTLLRGVNEISGFYTIQYR